MKIAFYVSGAATRLNKILEDNNVAFLQSIQVVISDDIKNQYLESKLLEKSIPYVLIDYKKLSGDRNQKNTSLSNEILELLLKYQVDYCFSFGGHILQGELLTSYHNRIINFHPSILPSYPGMKAIDQAVEAKANVLGNTAHFIDAGVDTGPIIMQSIIHSNAFYQEGYDAVLDLQIDMLYKIYKLLCQNKIKLVDGKVIIDGADYKRYGIFPDVD